MQHTRAIQHIKRAEQLMAFGAPKREKKRYTTPPGRNKRLYTLPRQSPQNRLQWWPVADQLQYPLYVHLSKSCDSSHTGDLKLTLGNIFFERVRLTDNDNEGNVQAEVIGRWSIIEKSGRYKNRVGRHLRFSLDVEKAQIVADVGHDPHFVCSATYGSQFYEYVLKDLISNIFVRVVTLLRKYGRNDLADCICAEDITSEGYPLSRLLYEVREQIGVIAYRMDEEGERDIGDHEEALRLLWPYSTVNTLVMLIHGASQ